MKVYRAENSNDLFVKHAGQRWSLGLYHHHGLSPEYVVALGVSDPWVLSYIPKDKMYVAGCREFVAADALEHWRGVIDGTETGEVYVDTQRLARAKKWVRLIEKNEAALAAERAKRRAALRRKRVAAENRGRKRRSRK